MSEIVIVVSINLADNTKYSRTFSGLWDATPFLDELRNNPVVTSYKVDKVEVTMLGTYVRNAPPASDMMNTVVADLEKFLLG